MVLVVVRVGLEVAMYSGGGECEVASGHAWQQRVVCMTGVVVVGGTVSGRAMEQQQRQQEEEERARSSWSHTLHS